jgi:hypothetical protein
VARRESQKQGDEMLTIVECFKCGEIIDKYNIIVASFMGKVPCPKCKKLVKYAWPKNIGRVS